MATINSLPAEILARIISLSNNEGLWNGRPWKAHCRAMSLVSKSWRWLAQKKLWSNVQLDGTHHVDKLCASPMKGRFATRQLSIVVYGWFPLASKERAIEACRGVEVLHSCGGVLPASIFELAALKGLRELTLKELEIQEPFPPSFQFSFTSLSFSEDEQTFPLPFIDALIECSRDTFTSLDLRRCGRRKAAVIERFISCLERFEPLAPRLLHLSIPFDTLTQLAPTVSFLRHATQLKSLKLYLWNTATQLVSSIFQVLPSTLAVLHKERFSCDATNADVIRSTFEAQPQLRHIVLAGFGRIEAGEDYLRAEERLREECEKRGVELRLDSL